MRVPIRLTLVIALMIAVSTLIIGALAPLPGPPRANSPYLSKLSDMAVQSAEAGLCYTYCFREEPTDPWQCANCFPCNTACHKFGTNQCENTYPGQSKCPTP